MVLESRQEVEEQSYEESCEPFAGVEARARAGGRRYVP